MFLLTEIFVNTDKYLVIVWNCSYRMKTTRFTCLVINIEIKYTKVKGYEYRALDILEKKKKIYVKNNYRTVLYNYFKLESSYWKIWAKFDDNSMKSHMILWLWFVVNYKFTGWKKYDILHYTIIWQHSSKVEYKVGYFDEIDILTFAAPENGYTYKDRCTFRVRKSDYKKK